MVKEYIRLAKGNTKGFSKMENSMDKVSLSTQMVIIIQDSLKITRSMV